MTASFPRRDGEYSGTSSSAIRVATRSTDLFAKWAPNTINFQHNAQLLQARQQLWKQTLTPLISRFDRCTMEYFCKIAACKPHDHKIRDVSAGVNVRWVTESLGTD